MITYFNSFAEHWMAYFGTTILQNTLFLGVIFLVLHVLRERDARIRYAVAALGLIKLLVPPFVPLTIKNAASVLPAIATTEIGDISVVATNAAPTGPALSVLSILLLIWIITVLFMLASSLISTLRLKWHLRDSSFIKHVEVDGKAVDIYCSPNISVPLSIGLFPKRIYVPMLWSSLSKELQHSLLRHEVAHIKRKDGLLGALQILAQAIYFFHPLVWILTRQADELREMACDDMAVDNSEVTPLVYSRCLVHVAEHMLPSWSCSSASTLIKQKNKLYHRVNYQVKETDMKQIPKHRSRLIWTLLLVLVVPLSWYCKQPDARIGVDNNKTGKIYGKVIDKKTGEALAGVNIIVYGTSQGAATNMNGEYSITKVKPGKYTVSASMIGYVNEIDKNIVVLNKTSRELNFELISKSIQGETIVISAKDAKGNIFKPATLAKSEKEAIPSPPAPPLPPELEVEFDSGPAPVDGFEAISKAIKYPTSAKKAGLECKVIASIYINENGDVIANKIQKTTSLTTKSTSFIPDTKAITDCEKAAIDALSSLKWIPAMNNKQAVGVWVTIPVSFRLPDKQGATQMKIQGKKSNTKFTASTSWPDDSGQIKPKDTQTSKEFVPYDTPPEPIGGMKTIAENLVYPEKAKEANEQGTVIIQAKINVNGNVEATEILRSFGSKVCDEAALKAIMLTKWTPAKQRDKDVSVWITVPIEFKLDNNK